MKLKKMFLLQFNQIVKLQARVKTLENTLEFNTKPRTFRWEDKYGPINNIGRAKNRACRR